jgi:hypothetical protein
MDVATFLVKIEGTAPLEFTLPPSDEAYMNSGDSSQPNSDAPQDQPPRPQHVSARVPEHVSRGIFSSGVLVMTGPTEFILDFVQNLGQPATVAARVVMPHATVPQFIQALQTNLEIYKSRFGTPPELPRPPQNAKKPTVQEIYDDLKISDDVLVGAYANGVMIGHSASEFKFDFLTNMIPHPAVSSRIYLSAPHAPRLLESLIRTFQDFQTRLQQQQQRPPQQPPPQQPPPTPPQGPEPDAPPQA